MVQLLVLDNNTWVNPEYIVEITLVNLNNLRRERQQHVQTAEQREQMDSKFWEVSVYLRSVEYNPQRFTKRFETEKEAKKWINDKFSAVIVNNL